MIYEYNVKHNGVFYKAGEDVPNGMSSKAIDEPKVEIPTVDAEEKPKQTKAKARK